MKTTLNLLKIGANAYIDSIKNAKQIDKHKIERLYASGIAPGRNVTLLNRKDDLYIAQIEYENPFCMREDLAELIEIRANTGNTYKNKQERDELESIFTLIRNLFK